LLLLIDDYEFCLKKNYCFLLLLGLVLMIYEYGDEDEEDNEGRR